MSIENLRKNYKFKERSIVDLKDYILNKTGNYPNFNLLLGAGCSISSGINSTKPLIEMWLKEYWLKNSKNANDFSIDETIKLLKSNSENWLNEKNLYSSLFENKFDLPRQRKVFIEKEVEGKFPNIGYAYLVNLVSKSFLNANFTTNYDDLLSDAFNIYGNCSPLVCSHESTINSITLSTNKPKIIKLHGDYLYDDLKSTENETKELELNMKNKFIEFCKDSGLIIVGYSGNDKSIMDVLKYLLKNDNYLNNGLYWCLRKDDVINEDLNRLFMKEKIYFVEIEGFDELFAYLHREILDNTIPFNLELISNKPDEIISNILKLNSIQNISNNIIKEDIQKLKNENVNSSYKRIFNHSKKKNYLENNLASDLDNDEDDSIEFKKFKKISDIENLIDNNQTETALNEIESELKLSLDSKYLKKLLNLKANIYSDNNQNELAIECYQMQIQKEIDVYINYIRIAELQNSYDSVKNTFNEVIAIDPFYHLAYNTFASRILEITKNDSNSNINSYINEIFDLLEKSNQCFPYHQNESYSIFLEVYTKSKELKSADAKNKIDSLFNSFYNYLKEQDPTSIIYFRYLKIKSKNEQNKYILFENDIKKYITESKKQNMKPYIKLLGNHYLEEYKYEELNNLIINVGSKYAESSVVASLKAEYYLKYKNDLQNSINILENYQKKNNDEIIYIYLKNYYLMAERYEDAKSLINTYSKKNKINDMINYYEKKEEYNNCLELINEEMNKQKIPDQSLFASKVYCLLHLEKFTEAKNITHAYLTDGNKWGLQEYFVEVINYEFACKQLSKKCQENRLTDIFSRTESNLQKAVISLLLGKKNDCYQFLDTEIKNDKSIKYIFRKWKVFQEIREESKFKEYYK